MGISVACVVSGIAMSVLVNGVSFQSWYKFIHMYGHLCMRLSSTPHCYEEPVLSF